MHGRQKKIMSNEEVTISIDATQSGERSLREILQERARILSEVPASEEKGGGISILSFQLGAELYGIELVYLTETRQSVPLRHVPCAPSHLAGIMSLRGELLPAVDLRPILGLPQQEPPKIAPALLILSLKGNKLAVVVDQAQDILTFPVKELRPPPLSLEPERALLITGELLVKARPLSLINVEKLFQEPRLAGETTQEMIWV